VDVEADAVTLMSDWAAQWGVPAAALDDLRVRLCAATDFTPGERLSRSEAAVQAAARVAASTQGMRLFRNNVGAVHDTANGVHIRFGLANDSPSVNAVIKSGDLIGIQPRLIGQADVGSVIGQFVSFECKREGWRWTGTDREKAQVRWAALVTSLGGIAEFISHPDQVSHVRIHG